MVISKANLRPAVDDEAALAARLKSDPRAFEELFDRHYEDIARYVYRRTLDRDVTEDIVSDVFLRALQAIRRYRHNGTPIVAWLLRIATNETNRRLRVTRVQKKVIAELNQRVRTQGPSDASSIEGGLAGPLLRSLSIKHQEVLVLHLGCGYAIDEIAVVLGCRPGTVKSRLSRARDALHSTFTRIHGDPTDGQ